MSAFRAELSHLVRDGAELARRQLGDWLGLKLGPIETLEDEALACLGAEEASP